MVYSFHNLFPQTKNPISQELSLKFTANQYVGSPKRRVNQMGGNKYLVNGVKSHRATETVYDILETRDETIICAYIACEN